MKIKDLFELYKEFIKENPESNQIFADSGMVNDFQKLEKGFFPLGSGILTEHSEIEIAEIEEGGTLVLGNDFGTVSYLKNKCIGGKEVNSKTIDNLKKLDLKLENTFFSNLFVGLRDDGNNDGTAMTKLVIKRKQEYIDFCFDFLKIQLDFIKPKIVVCLGVEVGKNLATKHYEIFSNFSQKDLPLTRMYEDVLDKRYIVDTNDKFYGARRFVLIPHPSFAHISWNKNDIKPKIEDVLRS